MANYDLGTVGFTIQNTGTNEAINGLNQVAQAANKVSPAAQRVIDSMKRLRETQRQVSQANEVVARSFTKLELDRAAQRMQGFEKALANTRGNMNNFGVVTQQVGYQVGDFLVQVQSGTNFMVALGQQATQLVGVLPMMNGLFGLSTSALVGLSAGLGIAIPLITAVGAYFLRSSEQADKANEAVKKYQQTLENLNSSLSETQVRLEAFRRGVAPDEMFEAALAIEELKRQLEGLLTTEISGLGDVFSRGNRIAEARALLNDMEKVLESLKQQNAEETRLEVAARLRANQKKGRVQGTTKTCRRTCRTS